MFRPFITAVKNYASHRRPETRLRFLEVVQILRFRLVSIQRAQVVLRGI